MRNTPHGMKGPGMPPTERLRTVSLTESLKEDMEILGKRLKAIETRLGVLEGRVNELNTRTLGQVRMGAKT